MKSIVIIVMAFMMTIGIGSRITIGSNITDEQGKQYKNISPAEAQKRLNSGEEIIILDVRTLAEYREKHIPKSLLIPLDQLEKVVESQLIDKTAPVFVYCRSGRRSAMAAEILSKLGYINIYNLGGILDWPYETETGNGSGQ
jgi:phage shock protein E